MNRHLNTHSEIIIINIQSEDKSIRFQIDDAYTHTHTLDDAPFLSISTGWTVKMSSNTGE